MAFKNRPSTYDYAQSDILSPDLYEPAPFLDGRTSAADLLFVVIPSDSDFDRRVTAWADSASRNNFRGKIVVASTGPLAESPAVRTHQGSSKGWFLRIREPRVFARRTGIGMLPVAMLFQGDRVSAILIGEFSDSVSAQMFANRTTAEGQTIVLQTVVAGRLEAVQTTAAQ